MRRRRIKLVWGASDVIRGRWYFGLVGLYNRVEGEREDGLAISLRGVTLWGLAMMAAAYVAATAALWSFWQRNPYCLLTYSDAFFYPVRRTEVAAKKGQAFIAEGQEMLKEKKWAEGARLLRQGLAMYPGDLSARLALARFYVMANQRVQASKLLGEDLPAEYPGRIYVQTLFDLAEQGEDHDLVVATAERYVARLTGPTDAVERRWLIGRKFAALLAAERRAEALAMAEAEEPGEMASEHRVLALVELGRAAEAVEFLAAWRQRPGADLRTVQRLEVRAFREAGRGDEMERALEGLRALNPGEPRQAVYGVVQRAMAGREAAAKAALEDFVFRFGGTAANLQMAAEPLAEIGNVALFERCAAAALERGYPVQGMRVLEVQLRTQRGEWAEAARLLAQMKPAAGRTTPLAEQAWLEWMTRLVDAAAGPAEAAQSSLVEFLRGRPWPMKIFRKSIEALRLAGRNETARDVIAAAEGTFPASRWVQAQKAEVAAVLTKRAIAESPGAGETMAATPVGERMYFERLDEALRERKWADAERLIREVRALRTPPAWMERRDGDMRFAEVRINQGRNETPAMRAAARLYLNGDAARSKRMTELAQEFFGAGDKAGAIVLVQAVLQRTPDHPLAERLLNEWQPRTQPAAVPKK